MICLWSFILHPLCMYPYVLVHTQKLSKPCTCNNFKKLPACCIPNTHSMYHFLNPVLPHGTQKHYSFSAGIQATQVHLLVHHLPRHLVCNSCIFFLSTICLRLTLTCGPACNIARSLAHVTSQLLVPICSLLGCISSI